MLQLRRWIGFWRYPLRRRDLLELAIEGLGGTYLVQLLFAQDSLFHWIPETFSISQRGIGFQNSPNGCKDGRCKLCSQAWCCVMGSGTGPLSTTSAQNCNIVHTYVASRNLNGALCIRALSSDHNAIVPFESTHPTLFCGGHLHHLVAYGHPPQQ
ncbi:hypothetical protein K402DRAFT_196862 [Aulographum hederae CBS 113979]|uniref:Uncharacterized protein n=1 Tax=Aulographum hederae CBS 113979 TaxID=1176131 RepID=A0A6G1GNE9_9PEZI|nr:hypothetical protein K402DRAFT_196862 [Aulographum hederae CBS 113979]